MRLLFAEIEQFKSIKQQRVPLEGLVVLFGANSAGKTNVLEAVDEMLEGKERMRRDPFDTAPDGGIEDTILVGGVIFELPGLEFEGHPDRELWERLHMGELGAGSYEPLIDPADLRALADATSIGEMIDFVAATRAEGDVGDPDDRAVVAHALMQSRIFVADAMDTWLVASPFEFPAEALAAAERIAALGDEESEDALWSNCRTLVAGHLTRFDSVGDGWSERPYPFVPVVKVDASSVDLPGEVEAAIDEADEQWHRPNSERGVWLPPVPRDPWVEELRPDGAEQALILDAGNARAWLRIRPMIHELASALAARATDLLPGFVRDQGQVDIRVLPFTMKAHEGGRIWVGLREHNGARKGVHSLGAATERWVAAAVRLACNDLRNATWVRTTDGSDAAPPKAHHRLGSWPSEEAQSWLRMVTKSLDDGTFNADYAPRYQELGTELFLVDEPEAHLHPAAVRSITDWLRQLSARSGGVIVATHAPQFLEVSPDEATFVYVERRGGETTLQRLPDSGIEALDGAAEELGLTRIDLLQHTRLMLFVEGPHDEIVLRSYIGDELDRARIRIVPIHGLRNVDALVDSELIGQLGIPAAVLSDNAPKKTSGARPTYESQAIDRVVQEARAAGRKLHAFGLTERDILHYLDPNACRAIAPTFPGWEGAVKEWHRSRTSESFKAFVQTTYQLRLDRRSVARLAEATAAAGTVPSEIRRLGRNLTALADRLQRNAWKAAPK